jgi:hypothetical protein
LTDLQRALTLSKEQAESLRTGLGELTSDISLVHDELISIQSGSEAPGDEVTDSVLEQVTLLHEQATELDRSLLVSDEAIRILRTVDETVLYDMESPLYALWWALAGVWLLTMGIVFWIRRRRRE